MAPKAIQDEPTSLPAKVDETLISYKQMPLPAVIDGSFKAFPQQQMFYQDQASDGYSYHYSDESKHALSFSGSIKSKGRDVRS